MTEFNFPWQGESLGKAGPYSDSTFAQYIQHLLANALSDNAGILVNSGNGTDAALDVQETSPQSKNILIREGAALVLGRWYYSDADQQITITDNTDGSGFDRIDLLVARSNSTLQTISLLVIEGTPAASPVAPSPVRSGAIYDIPLAEITAQNLFLVITDADIDTSVRESAYAIPPQMGGTGIDGLLNPYTKGDVIAAQGASVLGQVNIPDFGRLLGDSSASEGVVGLDHRVHQLRAKNTTAIGILIATVIPFANADAYNPAGYITSLASNQFTLEAGTYLVWGTIPVQVTGTQINRSAIFYISDTTAITTQLVLSNEPSELTNSGEWNLAIIEPQELVSDGVQTFSVYGEASASAVALIGSTGVAFSIGTDQSWQQVINIQRIK